MARTGQAQDTAANTAGSTNAAAASAAETADIGKFNQNEATLAKGGEVGADPFLNPAYLGNVNRLNADVLNANNQAGKTQLQNLNRRTGGLNTGATQSAISGLKMNTARLGTQLNSQRAEGDYAKNLAWQQYLAQAPLQAAGAQQNIYNTSTGEVNASDQALTNLGTASYGPWNALIEGLGKAGSAAVTGAFA